MNVESAGRIDYPAGRSWVGWALLTLALGTALRFCFLARDFELDDALIYQRYVRNVLAGQGLVYNPGEAFNALTSPLFTYLSIGAAWLLGDVRLGAIVLATACTMASIFVFYLFFARHGGPTSAALGALLAASSPFLYHTLRMETPLFMLLLGLCLLMADLDRTFWLGIAGCLLILTRSEGAFLLAALGLQHLALRRPLPRARDFVLPTLLLAAVLTFNWSTYGDPLPHTLSAKIDQGRSGLWGEWPVFLHAGYQRQWFFAGSWLLPLALAAGAAWGLVALRKRPPAWVIGLFLVQLALFYVVLNVPNYHWYYAPFYVLGFFLAATAIGAGLRWANARRPRWLRRALFAALAALAVLLPARLASITERDLSASAEPAYRRIGLWLRGHVAPAARLAAAEVGTLGWYSELHLIDMLGLVTPRNSRFLGERRFGAWLEHSSPDYVVVHEPPWPIERAVVAAAERGRFVREPRFGFDGFELYRSTGRTDQESIGELLERWRGDGSNPERSAAAREIFRQGLFDPVRLPGTDFMAVNLTADLWTRGTAAAGIAVHNPGSERRIARLRLACVATAADLPITAIVDDGVTAARHPFTERGFLDVELGAVAPGEHRLFILWTDKAWTPGPEDPRRLGVKLFAPAPEELPSRAPAGAQGGVGGDQREASPVSNPS